MFQDQYIHIFWEPLILKEPLTDGYFIFTMKISSNMNFEFYLLRPNLSFDDKIEEVIASLVKSTT